MFNFLCTTVLAASGIPRVLSLPPFSREEERGPGNEVAVLAFLMFLRLPLLSGISSFLCYIFFFLRHYLRVIKSKMAAFKVIRLLSDILEHRENIPGILVSIDFGKVFDLLERSRIHCTLQLLIW